MQCETETSCLGIPFYHHEILSLDKAEDTERNTKDLSDDADAIII
jgi:hypothetical protein